MTSSFLCFESTPTSKIFSFFILFTFLIVDISFAQSPDAMSYQAVIRDSDERLVMNSEVAVRISIIQGSETGAVVFSELHLESTNENGLLSLVIGSGMELEGDLGEIDWSSGPYFIRTETDPTGGSDFSLIAVSSLLSVPYALYATKSGDGLPSGDKSGEMLYWNGGEWVEIPAGNHSELMHFCDGVPQWGPCAPLVVLNDLEDIISTRVTGLAEVTHPGSSPVTERGLVWSLEPNPTLEDEFLNLGSGIGEFEGRIIRLEPETDYYVRAYATNEWGTTYSNELTVSTMGLFAQDIDGNIYPSAIYENLEWTTENLRSKRYANGDPIDNLINGGDWFDATEGAWAYYDHDTERGEVYGVLYNWYAASDSRNICPAGWRVPTNNEWEALITHLGGASEAGGKMKTTGTIIGADGLWQAPNEGATNESGFSVLPAGDRTSGGGFDRLTTAASFWGSTELNQNTAWGRRLTHTSTTISRANYAKNIGFSVRCVRNY
ncbi:MAG: hypothetical protein EA362_08730 [Saprospirales bacterium]|nr:MAG: hypothetical protein EA362_08730 [Saprospirales bacterium]